MGYEIESVRQLYGMQLVCLMTSMGHRCGYVSVCNTHPLWGVDYADENSEGVCPEDEIEAHGGITYSGDGDYPIQQDGAWWFGFDCGHYQDTSEKCTQEYVEEWCHKIALQLHKMSHA